MILFLILSLLIIMYLLSGIEGLITTLLIIFTYSIINLKYFKNDKN